MVGASIPISGEKDGASSILSQKRKRSSKSSADKDDKRLSPALLGLNVLDWNPVVFTLLLAALHHLLQTLREFSYDITYTTEDGYTMIYKSPMVKRILRVSFKTPQDNFMLIPHSLLRGDLLKLEICINELNQE
ncbi:hypothetical protein Bca4012_083583 [Brassica carinata]